MEREGDLGNYLRFNFENAIEIIDKLTKDNNDLIDKIEKLESLLHAALGPCPQCNGSGMIYIGSELEGMSLPDPCETCKGSGKIPLDVADMIEKFKKQARDDLESELTDDVPF